MSMSMLQAKESLPAYTSPDQVPQTAKVLWDSYDSTAEPLEVKVHKEWKADGVISRLITFKVGTFKGADSRIAAYYCFPENGKKNPAFVWSHGGGQCADRKRGHYFATQGFATVDINWLGRPLEGDTLADDPSSQTDWGEIDPTQGPKFYPKALRKGWKRSLLPDEFTVDPIASPRNANWFMLSLAGRRAITFLEHQAEVDADKLGFTGFSMGGTITSMTATDPRLKAVAPFVGGTGFLYQEFAGGGGSLANHFKDLDLYINTLDPAAYWPRVKCPVMFITSSNDFHSAFDRIYKSMDLLPHQNWRVTGNMHANHGPGPEQWVLLNQWFKQYLSGEEQNIPATPPTRFKIDKNIAHFSVSPDAAERLSENGTEIYYSYDPNPITRFWKKASMTKKGNTWKAQLTVHPQLPLYTFALCRYKLPKAQPLINGVAESFTLNSQEYCHIPKDLDLANYAKLEKTGLVYDSSSDSELSGYKFQDPELDTSKGRKLAITVNLKKGQAILLGVGARSKFLSRGANLGSFNNGRKVEGEGEHTIVINAKEFKGNKALEWSQISSFSVNINDAKTKKKIALTSPEGREIIKRIELIKDTSGN